MSRPYALLTPTLAAGLLIAAAPTDDSVTLRFAPAVGSGTLHVLDVEHRIEGGDLTVAMDGNPVPSQFLPELSFEFNTNAAVTVGEEYLKPKDGIEGAWRKRTLGDASQSVETSFEIGDESTESLAEATSELEGQAFLIGLGSDGELVTRWADPDCELDAALLHTQRPSFDLAGLLPEGPVSAGDTWEADAAALTDLLLATDSLPWTWTGNGADQQPARGETTFEGALELKVEEIGLLDDMSIICTVTIEGDLTETAVRPGDLSQVPVADGTATDTATTTYGIEGELVWNVTANRIESLTFEGTGEGTGEGNQVTVKDPGQPGPEYQSTTQHTAELKVELK